jgi:hypothetical protein
MYRSADKSLARPTSQFILFDGKNISFHILGVRYRASLINVSSVTNRCNNVKNVCY